MPEYIPRINAQLMQSLIQAAQQKAQQTPYKDIGEAVAKAVSDLYAQKRQQALDKLAQVKQEEEQALKEKMATIQFAKEFQKVEPTGYETTPPTITPATIPSLHQPGFVPNLSAIPGITQPVYPEGAETIPGFEGRYRIRPEEYRPPTEQDIRLKEAQIASLERGQDIIVLDSAGKPLKTGTVAKGAKVISVPEEKGIGKTSTATASMMGNVNSGLNAVSKLRDIYKGPKGNRILKKIGGAGAELLSIGDTEAQNALSYATEASDIIARLRTGAAINQNEERIYNEKLKSRFRTMEAQMVALKQVEDFFKTVKKEIETGKRTFVDTSIPQTRKPPEIRHKELVAQGLTDEQADLKLIEEGY